MPSPSNRFVSPEGPDAKPIHQVDVRFLESAPSYSDALQRQAAIQATLAGDSVVVIYRLSHLGTSFYLSRQIDPTKGGNQALAGEPAHTKAIAYDLFLVPPYLLSTSTSAPHEPVLSAAVKAICDFSQEPKPSSAGPN